MTISLGELLVNKYFQGVVVGVVILLVVPLLGWAIISAWKLFLKELDSIT